MEEIQNNIFYKDFLEKEKNFIRAPYNPEMEFYSAIKEGNEEEVRMLLNRERFMDKPGFGTLSGNALTDIKYHFVITAALAARHCIEGGMELSKAYTLSDYYIQKADACTKLHEVSDLHSIMCLDYTVKMKAYSKRKICSLHIANCLDFIYDNLHKRITVDMLSAEVGLNQSYLSRLFKKEVGCSISDYIMDKKMEAAQNMLMYSNLSLQKIAVQLAFPSQSYFAEVFIKKMGISPRKYRAEYLRANNITPEKRKRRKKEEIKLELEE